MRTPPQMPAELVPLHFAWDNGLYRRLADGSYKPINGLNGNKLICMFQGERINGDDIAWCLHYGGWPHYPLVQVDSNPFNTAMDNIFPSRFKTIRYRQTKTAGMYYHPLCELGFASPEACRKSWNRYAVEHYRKDLAYVLRQEEDERARRKATPLPSPASPSSLSKTKAKTSKTPKPEKLDVDKPPRPPNVPGRNWHYHNQSWLSVPEPVHVSDDYRTRCEKVLRGAVRFEFQPEYSEVWGFDAAGEVVK